MVVSTAAPLATVLGAGNSAGDEVLGPRVVADDRRRGLFGLVLPAGLLADLDAEALGAEQAGHGGVVLEVRTGRVAGRVAPTAVLLAEQPADARAVLVDEAPLGADSLVPVLGEGLGHLDAEPVQQEVALVLVGREQAGGLLADRRTHRDDVERGVVELARLAVGAAPRP